MHGSGGSTSVPRLFGGGRGSVSLSLCVQRICQVCELRAQGAAGATGATGGAGATGARVPR